MRIKKLINKRVKYFFWGILLISCSRNASDESNSFNRVDSDSCGSFTYPSFNIDSLYIAEIGADTLTPHPQIYGAKIDVGQEGYPQELNYLDYFLIDEGILNECKNYEIVLGESPVKDELSYKSIFLVIVDNLKNTNEEILIGKISNYSGRNILLTSFMENNRIIQTKKEHWISANGQYHNDFSVDTLFW